jgi:hypothetical protein
MVAANVNLAGLLADFGRHAESKGVLRKLGKKKEIGDGPEFWAEGLGQIREGGHAGR